MCLEKGLKMKDDRNEEQLKYTDEYCPNVEKEMEYESYFDKYHEEYGRVRRRSKIKNRTKLILYLFCGISWLTILWAVLRYLLSK
jgi:hypothetical protein